MADREGNGIGMGVADGRRVAYRVGVAYRDGSGR